MAVCAFRKDWSQSCHSSNLSFVILPAALRGKAECSSREDWCLGRQRAHRHSGGKAHRQLVQAGVEWHTLQGTLDIYIRKMEGRPFAIPTESIGNLAELGGFLVFVLNVED